MFLSTLQPAPALLARLSKYNSYCPIPLLQGTLVPVDPTAMFLSTLQLVLVPVLAGAAINQFFPNVSILGSCTRAHLLARMLAGSIV